MANNNLRSGQILSPFGIGQIVNFPKEVSPMICGLDLWDERIKQRRDTGGSVDESLLIILEPRLQKLLGVEYFKKPYPYLTSGSRNNKLTIPAVRFPKWHYCTNPRCGRMREVELTASDERIECRDCGSRMIPVRFVAACQHGHIQDVPFREWAHNGPVPSDNMEHGLRYVTGSGSGDLASIHIKCDCGSKKSLAGIMNLRKDGQAIFDSALASLGMDRDEAGITPSNPNNSNITGQYCKGERPWLGLDGVRDQPNCGAHLQVLIRGGSNVHYSNIMSALFLPQSDELSNPAIESVSGRIGKSQLKAFHEQDTNGTLLRAVLQSQPEVINKSIGLEELLAGVQQILSYKPDQDIRNEFDIRLEEFNYILKARDSENSDFKAIRKSLDAYDEGVYLKKFFDCVVLVEKLKEVRVFTGFSRITPDSSSGNRLAKIRELSSEEIKWLPAYDVYGEGIFLKFNDNIIQEWNLRNNERLRKLTTRYHNAMRRRRVDYEARDINAAFVMIHTFSHLLIKRLCYNCGYGSSSLRERIYFSSSGAHQMNGVLIYTSSGDSEGSLGGLVRQGKESALAKLIKDSVEDARWCSADPVCSEVGQSSGQGPDNINGSACHNCCIVPETSCEEFNMLLDRSTIVGTVNDRSLGYFSL